jgi:hypothetical protein
MSPTSHTTLSGDSGCTTHPAISRHDAYYLIFLPMAELSASRAISANAFILTNDPEVMLLGV